MSLYSDNFQDVEVKKEPLEYDIITCYNRILGKIQRMNYSFLYILEHDLQRP